MTKAVFFLPLYSSIQQTKCNQNKTSDSLLLIFFIDQSVLSPVILFWYYLNHFSSFLLCNLSFIERTFFRMSRHRPPRLCIDQSLPPPKQTGLMLNQVVFFTHSSPKKKKTFPSENILFICQVSFTHRSFPNLIRPHLNIPPGDPVYASLLISFSRPQFPFFSIASQSPFFL